MMHRISSAPSLQRTRKRGTTGTVHRSGGSDHSRAMVGWIRVFVVLASVQMVINLGMYLRLDRQRQLPSQLIEIVDELREQIDEMEREHFTPPYQHDDGFYPLTIRDAKHLTPVQVHPDFHIYDYVDPLLGKQTSSRRMQLWLDGYYLDMAPCSRYGVVCYKKKIIQVFEHLLNHTTADYFFYMESDNDLCVDMSQIRDIAYRHQRYFIGTGIGFSGWIMSRAFVVDFLEAYRPAHKNRNESPDPIGARLLMEKRAWSVTRQYLVSHTIQDAVGFQSLTVGRTDKTTGELKEVKHLPRCFEPKRAKWLETNTSTEDMHGWDYFDYDDCPPGTEIYPCREDQYLNISYGVKDMVKTKNDTQKEAELAAKRQAELVRRRQANAQRQERVLMSARVGAAAEAAAAAGTEQ